MPLSIQQEHQGGEMNIIKAIEYLENAEINCHNIKRIGLPLLQIVKEQIQSALKELNEDEEEGSKMKPEKELRLDDILEELIYKQCKTIEQLSLDQAIQQIKDWAVSKLEKKKDCGEHQTHYIQDEFCYTCNKSLSEEEYNKVYNYKFNQCHNLSKKNIKESN